MKPGLKNPEAKSSLYYGGLAVYRPLREVQSVDMILDAHNKIGDKPGVVMRGLGPEKSLAASIVTHREMKGRRTVGRLAVREVMDSIYSEVQSLRSNQEVGVRKVDFLDIDNYSCAALILEPDVIENERQQISEVIHRMAGLAVEDSLGLRERHTPHITVCKLPASSPGKLKEEVSQALEETAEDAVVLQRARFYTTGDID